MTVAEQIHGAFDRRWSKAIIRQGLAGKVTCSSGCYHCCAEAAYVERSEAVDIVAAISADALPGVIERLKTWVTNYKSSGVATIESPHVLVYRSANLMCPLLKDKKCLVYDKRPFACRGHCAIGDPKLCASNETRLEQRFLLEDSSDDIAIAFARLQLSVCWDHLGCHLSEMLLGERLESACRLEMNL